MKRILFVCSRNRLRSPTAEQVFAQYPEIEATSAGLASDAVDPLTPDHLEDIDIVFVMEKGHHRRLSRLFKAYLKNVRVVCLDIPDDYEFMQPDLITLLEARVTPHLR